MITIEKDTCPSGLPLPTMKILGRKRTEISIGKKKFFPIELEEILYKSNLNGVWYKVSVMKDRVSIIAEHRERKEYLDLVKEIRSNFEKTLNQKIEVMLVPPGSLYDYKEIRPGKPLSRVVDTSLGKTQIVEGA